MSGEHDPKEETVSLYLTSLLTRHLLHRLLPRMASVWEEAAEAGWDAHWSDYRTLLLACQDVLKHAPTFVREAHAIDVELSLIRSVERIATALAEIFPCGLEELSEYVLTDEIRQRRREALMVCQLRQRKGPYRRKARKNLRKP